MRPHRATYFAAGLLVAYLAGALAFVGGLWVFNAGSWRQLPVRRWPEEDQIDVA
jgi:hypothetical protein